MKLLAPVGSIINSYIANLLPACDPPLITLNAGTGNKNYLEVRPVKFEMYWYKGTFYSAAPALDNARLTAKIELAPNLLLHHPH